MADGKPGRRSKLTPEVHDKLVTAARQGNFLITAAAYAGVAYSTLNGWLAEGRVAEEGPKHDLYVDLERARAEAEVRTVALLNRAQQGGQLVSRTTRTLRDGTQETEERFSVGDVKAMTFFLQHGFPANWGGRSRVEVSGPDGGPIEVTDPAVVALRENFRAFMDTPEAQQIQAQLEAGGRVIEAEVVSDTAVGGG